MITVKALTKKYGHTVALDDVALVGPLAVLVRGQLAARLFRRRIQTPRTTPRQGRHHPRARLMTTSPAAASRPGRRPGIHPETQRASPPPGVTGQLGAMDNSPGCPCSPAGSASSLPSTAPPWRRVRSPSSTPGCRTGSGPPVTSPRKCSACAPGRVIASTSAPRKG